jgi:death-on-curing family protein
MDNTHHFTEQDLRAFIRVIQNGNYEIKKYLPPITENWYKTVSECSDYINSTAHYEKDLSFREMAARLLYKIVKKHELRDGNKRSGVIATYLFCIINDHLILKPGGIKNLAKKIASTKGRTNEPLIRKRVAKSLANIILSQKEIDEKYGIELNN